MDLNPIQAVVPRLAFPTRTRIRRLAVTRIEARNRASMKNHFDMYSASLYETTRNEEQNRPSITSNPSMTLNMIVL